MAQAADGFNLMFPLLPDDLLNFAELVVPELQYQPNMHFHNRYNGL